MRDTLSTDFSVTSLKSSYSRLDMILGTVVKEPKDGTLSKAQIQDYYDQQVQKIRTEELDKWLTSTVLNKVKAFNKEHEVTGIKISCFHMLFVNYEILSGIYDCLIWSSFSFAFVFLYSYYHIGSVPLTFLGLSHVMVSFPVGWFFCK